MISIYEAVAPVVQQQKKPVPGAVVPQVQQQPQPAQVPAQQANTANQPAANAGHQQNSATQTQQPVNSAAGQQQTQLQPVNQQQQMQPVQSEPTDWKKYLKYAGLIGGGLALGGGLYALGKYGGLPGASMPFFGDSETDTVDNDGAEATENTKARTQSAVRNTRSYREPLPLEGPPPQQHIPMKTNGEYDRVWPQVANARKSLNHTSIRQGYSPFGWNAYGYNEEASNVDSNHTDYNNYGRSGNFHGQAIYTRPKNYRIGHENWIKNW